MQAMCAAVHQSQYTNFIACIHILQGVKHFLYLLDGWFEYSILISQFGHFRGC